MSSPPVVVTPTTALSEAIDIMTRHRISCLVVVDEQAMFAGLVTAQAAEAHMARLRTCDWPAEVTQEPSPDASSLVRDALPALEPVVEPEAPLSLVEQLVIRDGISHIGVVNKGKPIGIIARRDLGRFRPE